MAKQIVMDATGDTKYEFNPADAAALKKAERRFKELTGAGFIAAVRTSSGQSELIREFNPAAEETVFFPRRSFHASSSRVFSFCACGSNPAVSLINSPSQAEQRASTLLKNWLTREQCLQYQLQGYFEVTGSHTGKRYRIRHASQMNVDQLDARGHPLAVLCFLPEKYVPVSDVMLSQKIMLENDEPAALSVANRLRRRRPHTGIEPLSLLWSSNSA